MYYVILDRDLASVQKEPERFLYVKQINEETFSVKD